MDNEKYENIIVTHTCRNVNELDYSNFIINECNTNEIYRELIDNKLIFYQTTTREKSNFFGRITEKLINNSFFDDLKIFPINPEKDRAMICGSLEFNTDLKKILLESKFKEGATNKPGEFVLEKAFVG